MITFHGLTEGINVFAVFPSTDSWRLQADYRGGWFGRETRGADRYRDSGDPCLGHQWQHSDSGKIRSEEHTHTYTHEHSYIHVDFASLVETDKIQSGSLSKFLFIKTTSHTESLCFSVQSSENNRNKCSSVANFQCVTTLLCTDLNVFVLISLFIPVTIQCKYNHKTIPCCMREN